MKRLKQKLAGVILIALSVICVVLKDGTVSIILTPIGIYTLLTKEDVMTNSTKNNSFEDKR